MPRTRGFWTCQRVTNGVRCGNPNPNRRKICKWCGKPRPARRKPAHMAVLEQPRDWWTEQFGTRCGICGCEASDRRNLDRDHDHATGDARGVLCHLCNRTLSTRCTLDWLRKAVAYLERFEQRRGNGDGNGSATQATANHVHGGADQ